MDQHDHDLPVQNTYPAASAGSQAKSPFANSPYVTNFSQESAYIPEKSVTVKPPKKKKFTFLKKLIIGVLAAAFVTACSCATAAYVSDRWERETQQLRNELTETINTLRLQLEQMKQGITAADPDAAGDSDASGMLLPSQVYAQNVDAVVAISNQGLSTNIFGQVSKTASSGSGFIISADGYVVSNYHVVQGASKLTVILASGQEYAAQLVGYDATNDISVLKIEGTDLPYVKLGSSDSLVVGDRVAAIGNPLGELTSSMTVGYVSAKDRNVNTDGTSMNMLQTDASINSGNSGGPLFNMYGEVIGITTAKYSGTSTSGASIEGIGFAIPIDDVSGMIDDIINKGYVSGAYLGVVVEDVSAEDAKKYGLPLGALITDISAGFAAERAGLQVYDIIVSIGGKSVSSINELTRALRDFSPGQTTQITVYRSGESVTMDIQLDEKPQQTDTTQQVQPTQPEADTQQPSYGGFGDYFWPFFG